jgi:hypothetical protein
MKSNRYLPLFLGISLLFSNFPCRGTEPVNDTATTDLSQAFFKPKRGIDFFNSEELLQMTLSFDIREFLKTKDKPEYYKATLTIRIDENDSITQPIKIKARGAMRRNYCSFPPIMLKFDNKDPDAERIIQDRGKLKLVTHCDPGKMFENYVIREYLAYKMYNLVTPYSFKTRLVRINYVDTNPSGKSYTRYGFLIEDPDDMSARNNSVITRLWNLNQKNMISQEMARVALFNYMIGNTDWSVTSQHNVKVLKSIGVPSEKAIPVVYDFDYSGLVNTIYAIPVEGAPAESVVERYYTGMCFQEKELYPVIEEFGALKDQILGTISDFEYLSDKDKKWPEHYINDFYKMYNHPKDIVYQISQTCKQF